MISAMDISYEQVRSLAMETLKTGEQATQFTSFYGYVAEKAVQHGFLKENDPRNSVIHTRRFLLSKADQARTQNILWDLIIEGILRPGLNDGQNNNLPFFHVTKYGKAILQDGSASPYDPDGYIKRLKDAIPKVDSVILTYLNEALRSFRIGCLLSSTVTLGCASEKAFLLLVGTYGNSLSSPSKEKFVKNTEGRMIKRQYDEFQKMLDSELKARLPSNLKDDLDITLSGIFSMIRTLRNNSGHPTGREVNREQAYANLVVFPTYLKRIYALLKWLETNPSTK